MDKGNKSEDGKIVIVRVRGNIGVKGDIDETLNKLMLYNRNYCVRSSLRIPDPLSNCRTMDAVTIGPMPKLMRLPNSAPKITEKN